MRNPGDDDEEIPLRAFRAGQILAWLNEAPEKRRPELADVAKRLGIAGGRPWSQFTDEEIGRLWYAVFSGDFRSDAEFDDALPF